MVKQCLQYVKGYVRIRVTGNSYERFLNMCARHQIELWDLEAKANSYEMNLSIRGFRRLRPLARKSSTKVRIIERYGLPFFLYKYRKRKLLLGGFLFGIFLMFFLSGFIWDIHIEGNLSQTNDVIFDFLTEQKICHGTRKGEIDCKDLAARMRKAFDNFIWVSVKIEGTRLLIDVKENTDLSLDDRTEEGVSDLISNVNGTVRKIITRAGAPQVAAGDVVKKGQPLVIGQIEILDDAGEVADYLYCAADADIYIETRYLYEHTIPMKYIKKEYTGRMKRGGFVRVAGKTLTLAQKASYEFADIFRSEQQLHVFRNFYLPVNWGEICQKEYVLTEKRYSKKEAVEKEKETLSKFLWKIQEKGVQILQNNVKIEADAENCTAKGEIVLLEQAGQRMQHMREDSGKDSDE